MTLPLFSLASALLGAALCGRYLAAVGPALGWGLPAWSAIAYAVGALLLMLAGAGLRWAVDAQDRRGPWRSLAWGGAFVLLLAQPLAERLRLPDPHDLLERKRQLLLAAPGALWLLANAVEQALALRGRLQRGRGAAAWPFVLPLIWLLLSAAWTTRWNMTGDAPHYMLISHSLVQDGDIDLKDDFEQGEAAAFYPRMPLITQDKVIDGRMISWHKPGLSLLMAPAYGALGPGGAIVTLCVLAALLAGALWALLGAAGFAPEQAWWAWAAVLLSPPFYTQGAIAMTEVPAALYVALAFWGLLRLQRPAGAWAFAFAVLCLPWLNSRFFSFYPVLALALLWRARGLGLRSAPAFAGLALGVLSSSLYTLHYFGDPSPTGGMTQASLEAPGFSHFSLAWARSSFFGQLWDQEFGLGLTAPFWLLGLAGLGLGARQGRWSAWAGLGLFALTYGMLSIWFGWTGQITPNRFYTPLLPVLALGLAAAAGRGWRAAWMVAGAVSLGLAWAYSALPWLAFNRADGANWILKIVQAPLRLRLNEALPSFLPSPGPADFAWALALSAALAFALARALRPPR